MRNKYLVIGCVALVVLLLSGGGFWFLQKHKVVALNDGAGSINVEQQAQSQAQDNQSGSGLGVASGGSTATDLGQLGGSSQSGSQGTATTNGGSGSSGSSSTVDPSTFAQYDKYATGTSALFGDIQVGNGAAVGASQQVAIAYKGWLTNGTLFDQSHTDSSGKIQPLVFKTGAQQVIPGMEEGVAGMKVGGTRLIIIPPAVGYGSQGTTGIPPNSVLVFEVQLLQV
ncbi:MAG TPA: FKBP-type peptidyl-prolyl cis-trans isomerase [Candidatus Saccharimonadia bacterium]|nr:FKBP-type peptidyl-prolyl cis-trans isomerase [Candidatus Saccharimonadia bacterium]